MQTQQELSNIDHHAYAADGYGWLTKLNWLAIALFALAFLMVDDDARWLCGTAIFFSFIFIFVLNALTQQQRTIAFQQRQIQGLIEAQKQWQEQTSLTSSMVENDLSALQPSVIMDEPISTSVMTAQAESHQTENRAQDDLFAQSIPETRPLEQQAIYADVQTHEEFSHAHIQENHQNDAQNQPELLLDDSESIKKQQVKQDSSLIKDLKGMTSLWSAFVGWFKGGNSIVRMGIIVLLIGVILLLRFASQYWQPTLSTKLAGVAVAGMLMTGIGYWLRNKRHSYAISVQGAGLGVLYLVLFSAFKLAVITSVSISYGLLILLLAVTLLLALRQNALILAFIALGSGFIAPFILNTGSNNIPALFTYYLALNTALAVIALFKPWRILNTISLLATFGVGGLRLWMKAEPEQYRQLTVLVWLHFALYLFISIRYSLNISKYKTAFKNVPLIDTALIFATPFMAFTLYAGLVYHNPRLLSWASAVLALVYFSIGYMLHKKYQRLSVLIQSFYGLGLTFFALILPFAFNAQWTSTGWAVQAIALIWMGCRHHLRNSLLFGLVLLGLSTVSWIKGLLLDGQLSLLAVLFLSMSYLAALYIFYTPQLNEKTSDDRLEDRLEDHSRIEQSRFSSFVDSLYGFAKVGCFIALQVIVLMYSNTLYMEDLFSQNAIFMLILTLVSAVLAWRVDQVDTTISAAVQIFTGLALFYFAMIPVMLWQADIISIWWTVQALSMLIVASVKGAYSIRKGASILLLASSVALIVAIFDANAWRYLAAGLLVMGLAINSYWLWYTARPETEANDRLIAHFSLLLSFLFCPYLANKLFDLAHWDIISIALPMLIWWSILTVIYKYKQHVVDPIWMWVTCLILGGAALEIATIINLHVNDLQIWTMPSEYKLSILTTIILWGIAFAFCVKTFTLQLNLLVAQGSMVVAVILLAILGGVIAWNELSFIPLLLLLPVVMLFSSLKFAPLHCLKSYWMANLAIVILGLVTVWLVSFVHEGQWNLFYLTLLNPLDLLSIAIFTLCLIAIKPLIDGQSREMKIASTAVLIITGLILISSIMLRSLHHYLNLPYWSIAAWHNGVVQASLTILWVVLALVLTTFASKKALRYVWMLGIAVLALVIVKLIFLDLSHTQTITRIVSFIGSGLVMLLIGYFAPLPPAQHVAHTESES